MDEFFDEGFSVDGFSDEEFSVDGCSEEVCPGSCCLLHSCKGEEGSEQLAAAEGSAQLAAAEGSRIQNLTRALKCSTWSLFRQVSHMGTGVPHGHWIF